MGNQSLSPICQDCANLSEQQLQIESYQNKPQAQEKQYNLIEKNEKSTDSTHKKEFKINLKQDITINQEGSLFNFKSPKLSSQQIDQLKKEVLQESYLTNLEEKIIVISLDIIEKTKFQQKKTHKQNDEILEYKQIKDQQKSIESLVSQQSHEHVLIRNFSNSLKMESNPKSFVLKSIIKKNVNSIFKTHVPSYISNKKKQSYVQGTKLQKTKIVRFNV